MLARVGATTAPGTFYNLNTPAVWYSYPYGDLVDKTQLSPWGNWDRNGGLSGTINGAGTISSPVGGFYEVGRSLGYRHYELTDHLGNVLATVLDRKLGSGSVSGGSWNWLTHTAMIGGISETVYDYFNADIATAQDYYPFGMLMPGRASSSTGRFGFNGQQNDNEIAGAGNYLNFGERMYDSRLAHIPSIDPYATKFPWQSPYVFAGNNPIQFIDKGGAYKVDATKEAEYRRDYPLIMAYMSSQVQIDILRSTKIMEAYHRVRPMSTETGLRNYVKAQTEWGNGPTISFDDAPCWAPGANGCYDPENNEITFNATYAKQVERVLRSGASTKEKLVMFMRFFMTVVHETGHRLNYPDRIVNETLNPGGEEPITIESKMDKSGEVGYKVEDYVWGYPGGYEPNKEIGGTDKRDPGVVEGVIDHAQSTPEGRETLPTVPTTTR